MNRLAALLAGGVAFGSVVVAFEMGAFDPPTQVLACRLDGPDSGVWYWKKRPDGTCDIQDVINLMIAAGAKVSAADAPQQEQ